MNSVCSLRTSSFNNTVHSTVIHVLGFTSARSAPKHSKEAVLTGRCMAEQFTTASPDRKQPPRSHHRSPTPARLENHNITDPITLNMDYEIELPSNSWQAQWIERTYSPLLTYILIASYVSSVHTTPVAENPHECPPEHRLTCLFS